MVSDVYLGNTDRLIGGGAVNLGNFFYDTSTGKVKTIDNESKSLGRHKMSKKRGVLSFNSELAIRRDRIEGLIGFAGQRTAITRFLDKFKHAYHENQNILTIIDDEYVQKWVSTGILQGLTELSEAIGDGGESPVTDLDIGPLDSSKGFAKYLKDRLNGVTTMQAKANLTSYLKYRDQRHQTGFGGKWTTKLKYKFGGY